ncbi:hypothetical protein L7F22_054334 [Adiantum nelumboides]|nr:hypothetical protein [Adiantum nelumboides]
MSFQSSNQRASRDLYLPADVHWDMLDKSKFFILGAALFSGVSATLYPVMVLKTRQQVSSLPSSSSLKLCGHILQHEGLQGLYRGFSTSLLGTIPARVLYMSTLEVTKSIAVETALTLGFSASTAATSANAVGGLAASVAAQLVWTPVDVISQRLMVQVYNTNGWMEGLYRGFGMSILTYAPSNALWWGSYCLAQRTVWGSLGYHRDTASECSATPSASLVFGVQSASAACAGGVTALLTTPLDTIKTRLQVENKQLTVKETIVSLVKEGGWRACYKGFGPRWSMMAMSAVTMITTYEFLKRSSTKQDI